MENLRKKMFDFDENTMTEFSAKKVAELRPYKRHESVEEEKMREIYESFTEKQREAFEMAKAGKNMFITSSAGCGKTYLLNALAFYWNRIKHKNLLITATTGTASLLCNGMTVHKAFGFDIGVQFTTSTEQHVSHAPNILVAADVLIIEEISMARCDLIDSIYLSIEKANQKRKEKHKKPIIVFAFGDLLQLPPVITKTDKQQLEYYYGRDIKNGYCFQGDYWDMFKFKYFELDEVVRQSDKEDKEILNKIRVGDTSCYMRVNEKMSTEAFENAVYMYPFNAQVAKKNREELAKIKGKEKTFTAETDGNITIEEVEEMSHNANFTVKERAKVFVTCNPSENAEFYEFVLPYDDDPMSIFRNGARGTVLNIDRDEDGDYIIVEMDESKKMVKFRQKTYDVYDYRTMPSGKLIQFVRAKFKNFPLRLAYAQSIHSTQGQTFDYINLNPRNCFASSQLYVALSRCKSLEHIHLEEFLRQEDIMVDTDVIEFYDRMRKQN